MSKKILILGANGMLGGSLHRHFTNSIHQVIGTVRSEKSLNQIRAMGFENILKNVEVTDYARIQNLAETFKPDYIFNCVGLIKQLDAGNCPTTAIEINSLVPHKLAEIASMNGSKLIHFSTDCIFSGNKGGYVEDDTPDACDIYGRSKLLGEVGYGGHLTLRTSIIGHEIDTNLSLVDWFLSQDGSVNGYSNAVFSGLPTCYIAQFIEKYIFSFPNISGVYHLSVDPIDKFSLLTLIKKVYLKNTVINNFESFRIDRSLNSDLLRKTVNYTPPSWEELIEIMYEEYKKYFDKR